MQCFPTGRAGHIDLVETERTVIMNFLSSSPTTTTNQFYSRKSCTMNVNECTLIRMTTSRRQLKKIEFSAPLFKPSPLSTFLWKKFICTETNTAQRFPFFKGKISLLILLPPLKRLHSVIFLPSFVVQSRFFTIIFLPLYQTKTPYQILVQRECDEELSLPCLLILHYQKQRSKTP